MPGSELHYNRVARGLHWTIGILIILNLAFGILHDPLEDIVALMPIHKSIGFTVLGLTVFRLVWRIAKPGPALPPEMPGWERLASHLTHWAFYALMFILPLSGWIFSSAGKWPLPFYGLFEIPKLAVDKSMPIVDIAHEAHEILGFAWIALILLHVGAALRHHFILKDNVLIRMWRGAPGA